MKLLWTDMDLLFLHTDTLTHNCPCTNIRMCPLTTATGQPESVYEFGAAYFQQLAQREASSRAAGSDGSRANQPVAVTRTEIHQE